MQFTLWWVEGLLLRTLILHEVIIDQPTSYSYI